MARENASQDRTEPGQDCRGRAYKVRPGLGHRYSLFRVLALRERACRRHLRQQQAPPALGPPDLGQPYPESVKSNGYKLESQFHGTNETRLSQTDVVVSKRLKRRGKDIVARPEPARR